MSNNHRASPTGRKSGYRRTVTVATGSLVTQSVTVVTATLTGLSINDVVTVNPTTTLAAGVGIAYAFCAAANVLSVAFGNHTAATIATSNASLRVNVAKYTA